MDFLIYDATSNFVYQEVLFFIFYVGNKSDYIHVIYYEDLLTVPYKEFGRDMTGLDCYGLVLEMCRRNGTPLIDFVYHDKHVKNNELNACLGKVNVYLIQEEERKPGDIVEWDYEKNLHVGFLLDENTIIHATFEGVRITPYLFIKNKEPKFGRIEKW